MFSCDTNTCKFDGECLKIGNMVKCICDFKVRLMVFVFILIVCLFQIIIICFNVLMHP